MGTSPGQGGVPIFSVGRRGGEDCIRIWQLMTEIRVLFSGRDDVLFILYRS